MLVELSDVPVQSLVPEPLRALAGGDEYMARLPEFDGEMEQRLKEAEATGEVLRYVGVSAGAECCFGFVSTWRAARAPFSCAAAPTKRHPFAFL